MEIEQPKKRRKGFIIWLILLLVFGLLVILLLISCKIKNIVGLGLSCYSNKAISENNVGICNELLLDSQAVNCYKKYAVEKKDTSVCEDIPDGSWVMGCYRLIAQVPENRITLCNDLPSSTKKLNCYAAFLSIKDTIEECNLLSGFNKDLCYRLLSSLNNEKTKANDVTLCDSIIDSREKQVCKNEAFLVSVSKDTLCADSDGGINEKIKGIVLSRIDNVVYQDQCLGFSLIEHYCEGDVHQQKEISCSCNEDVCP